MIHRLREYAAKNCPDTESGFAEKDIKWAIVLDRDGEFLETVELGDVNSKNNKGLPFPKCPNLNLTEMRAGGETKSHFLADTIDVITLYDADDRNGNVHLKHEYFKKLLKDASSVMPELAVISESLNNPKILERIRKSLAEKKAKSTDKASFRLGGAFVLESDRWHQWWREFRRSIRKLAGGGKIKEKSGKMISFLSGESVEPVRIHPKIKHLVDVDGRSAGDVLIGFKQESFCSFGFTQSLNAAMSEEEANIYSTALNKLIKDHCRKLAGAKVVHWFKENIRPEDDPLPWLQGIEETGELNAQQKARELLESIRIGKRPDLQNNFYYALTLSGASGRVMVRDWMEGRFEELVKNIQDWFDDLSITNISGKAKAKAPKLENVITCLLRTRKVNEDYKNWIKPVGSARIALWKSAIAGAPIPNSVMSRIVVVNRTFWISGEFDEARKENNRNLPMLKSLLYTRMGLLKAYHLREGDKNMSSALNTKHPNVAYHCGRLLYVLARLQEEALPKIKTGIIQRYYSAASATPALVIGQLIAKSKAHLRTLGKEKEWLSGWFEKHLKEICNDIDANTSDIPETLGLKDQSLFALGYYHQMAYMSPKKDATNNNNEEENNE